jgi:hypothetical protein
MGVQNNLMGVGRKERKEKEKENRIGLKPN